ncbi:MAG: T9SS type A sorting domain-containing protein, partial [Calditrichaeota bacterium]|nr:T9SS type A sorting domain-containing protein [Calditrichota bacterium]
EFEFNNIPGWFSYEGYQMLMSGAAVLALRGESVLRDDPIDLQEGWQLISYYPRFEVEATLALSGIVEQLVIAKDGHGNFYLPAWDDFSNMGNMGPGNGYFINVSADDTLIYRLDVDDEERLMSGADIPVCRSDQAWLSEPQPGECSFSLLLLTEDLSSGTRLEAYTPSGELAGRGIVDDDGKCGMALWGKDVGFSDGDKIRISIPGGADIPVCQLELQWLDGETSGWKADGWGVARLTGSTEMPVEFGIVSAYPNPFNSTTRITYSLPEAAIVNLTLFDISGREVASIVNGYRKAGVYEANISAENLSSGLYFIKLDDSKQIVTRKLMLIK